MADFSESLTIRILGDSTGLQRELEAVTRRLSELQRRLSEIGDVNQTIGRTAERFGGLARPLENVSRRLDHIAAQARSLARIPIRLNVIPALRSLAVLSRAIDAVGAKAQRLRIPAPAGIGGIAPLPFGRVPVRPPLAPVTPVPRVPRLAQGGLVNGPPGVDRIPALLSAGEFVVRQPVVQRFGPRIFHEINQSRGNSFPAAPADNGSANTTSKTENRFGDIVINVTQPADVNTLVRDLRFQGFRLRNRRG